MGAFVFYGLVVVLLIVLGGAAVAAGYVANLKRKKLLYDGAESIKIDVIKDFVYKQADGRELLMDIYKPHGLGENDKLPAVILVHGEGPELFIKDAKDWGLYTSYGRLLAQTGFVGIAFNHRRAAFDPVKADQAAQDVLDAIRAARRNDASWNIDAARIGVWTFSAGGLYLGPILKAAGRIGCLVSYYGLLDIRPLLRNRAVAASDVYRNYLPEHYLPDQAPTPPLLIVKAAKDSRKINAAIDSFCNVAKQKGIRFDYLVHASGRHAFDALDDNAETREVIRKTLDFIKDKLQP